MLRQVTQSHPIADERILSLSIEWIKHLVFDQDGSQVACSSVFDLALGEKFIRIVRLSISTKA